MPKIQENNNQNQDDIIEVKDWKNIHPKFTEELQKEWEKRGFSYEQCKEWMDIDSRPEDVNYFWWLMNIKLITPENILNESHNEQLRQEYKTSHLSEEAIEQIKKLPPFYFWDKKENKWKENLAPEQKSLIEQLIPNEELRKRYESYGLCQECQQPNTWSGWCYRWCQPCNYQHLQENNWTSGNEVIDQFIKKYQLTASDYRQILEWIPYDRFTNIEYLDEGGFGKVYKATWIDGSINFWNIEGKKWERNPDINRSSFRKKWNTWNVVLKDLNNSQNNMLGFLQEIANLKLLDGTYEIVQCYGISQDPKTRNYIIVMSYINGGSLRKYWNNYQLSFKSKLIQLRDISLGLGRIHEKGLIHRDFHPGNILNRNEVLRSCVTNCYITDLGLCQPANETNSDKVYGVLPYVAPEVLRGEPYTQTSDIYSFSMVAYEIISGYPPYYDVAHNESLALLICQGLRPNLNIIEPTKVPQLLVDLVEKCWDADPKIRPTAYQLYKTFYDWYYFNNDAEFSRQYKELKELGVFNKLFHKLSSAPTGAISNNTKKILSYQTHPQATYTSSLLGFENLPEPKNSKEINIKYYSSLKNLQGFIKLGFQIDDISFQSQETNLEEQIESSTQAQIQIPPK